MSHEPDPQLLQRAVDDRKAHPWRYYKLGHEQMKKIADEQAERIQALEAQLATRTHELHEQDAVATDLMAELATRTQERDDYRAAYEDAKRVARELDIAMHGEAGAAKQASLCDLVGPARDLKATVLRLRTALNELVRQWWIEAKEIHADGDYCCGKTRQHDADQLNAIIQADPLPAAASSGETNSE